MLQEFGLIRVLTMSRWFLDYGYGYYTSMVEEKTSLCGKRKGDTFICGMRAGPPYANPVYS